ncbi:MAG: bifunctional hydroxymethylpyrimidine kinase/phosphomethylpyrimidine kinase [Lachnospiraceae bacterium]|nr:bifunctional hydroxymethylpyrimidine kinase/phosphomethylpyrimidine kinase [Lachnospiraceae bacterium]
MQSSPVVVIGGANVDIGAKPYDRLLEKDSAPGRTTFSLGGVGRNIAHNLSLLGAEVSLLSAVGDDMNGSFILNGCNECGIRTDAVLRCPDLETSSYLFISDEHGEMQLAISDMEICNRITPEYLQAHKDLLLSASVVVADCNIPRRSLQWLAETVTAPLFVDPVSTAKAERARPILSRIHTIKPNRLEAEILSGVPIHSIEDAKTAAGVLLYNGVQHVFLSLSEDGIVAATKEKAMHLPSPASLVLDTTGCGDAFMAALVWALLKDLPLSESAGAALTAASIAMESPFTISENMSEEALLGRMHTKNEK